MSKKTASHEIHYLLILDKSGSMEGVRDATIEGINGQIDAIKSEKNEDVDEFISIVTFSTDHEVIHWRQPLDKVEKFTRDTYSPAGGTALFDSMGTSINRIKDDLKAKLAKKDANVAVTVFTDGEENSSRQYSATDIQALIKEADESRLITIAFMGCDKSMIERAQSLGVKGSNTKQYVNSVAGTRAAFADMSSSNVSYKQAIYGAAALKSAGLDDQFERSLDAAQQDFFTVDNANKPPVAPAAPIAPVDKDDKGKKKKGK